jgi:phage terminase large subunit-like protein
MSSHSTSPLSRIQNLTPSELSSLKRQWEQEALKRKQRKISNYYPETGPLRRELYPKHMTFFQLGKMYRERMFMAANRSGKTEGVGAFETVLHATGLYDKYAPWWEGHRFERPISAIIAGDTNLTTRDILQTKVFGKLLRAPGDSLTDAVGLGTGMMPADVILRPTARRGAENAYEEVTVRHISGGTSVIKLRSFEQGAEAFQGTEEDLIWLDECFPSSIYSEAITRLSTTKGHLLMTFTPIEGVTEIVREFMETAYRG